VTDQGIVVFGIPIPSSSPLFLSIVAVHVAAGLVASVAGLAGSGVGPETPSTHGAPPSASVTLRVRTDEKASPADARDRIMRSVPFHYGWMILVAGGIGAFTTLPGQTNGVALFFDPLAADLGLTRAQIALAYTIGTLAGILPAPRVGRWIDRRGPRLAGGAIAIAMGLACVAMPRRTRR
jgi:hypothetical protein